LKVVLGTLKSKGEELTAFLEPRVGAKPSLSGDTIEIEDESVRAGVRPRHVKTYIKRFLYMNGVRKNYRVFVVGKELTVQEIELGEKEEKKEEKKEMKEVKEEEPAPEEEEPQPEKPKKAAVKRPRKKKAEKEK
jgi:hypothetical protein